MDHIWRGATFIVTPLPGVLRTADRVNGRLRGTLLKLRIMATGGKVGKRLSVGPRVRLIAAPGARLSIGDRVNFSVGAVISIGGNASLTVGDDAYIGHYTLIGVEKSLIIGERAQIAEHCSVRDHDHDTSAFSMQAASVICVPVSIGTDSWVGRGVAILKGARVGAGAVVGANAVVRGNIPERAFAVGVPARVLHQRRIERDVTHPEDPVAR